MSEGEHGEGGHGSEIPWWMSIMPDVADIGLGLAGEHGPGDIAGLGPLGIITGPLGIAAGLHEIDEGKYAEGGFGTAAGVASTTEGLASIVGAAAGEGTAVAAG
ncbi:MAG: hypothetical protein KC464_03095, partial [Myxococcales bacterium]|nr:hypothetical protein [Myxococcales bacterium]